MSDIHMLAIVIGGITGLLSLPCLAAPERTIEWIRDFPRNKFAAWIMSAVGVTWVAWLLFITPLGWVDNYKPSLYVLAPGFFLLVVNYMDELLAPRALGGILLLLPSPIIDIARQRGLLLVSLAYVLVVIGITLVLSPYMFRKTMAFCIASHARCRTLGYVGMGIGVFIAAFGLLLY